MAISRRITSIFNPSLLTRLASTTQPNSNLTPNSQSNTKMDDLLEKYDLLPKTKEILRKKGFTDLLPIQREMLTPILENKSVVGRDITGSGKTLAYIIPILDSLRKQQLIPKKSRISPYVLVIAPTRELVIQVGNFLICRLVKNLIP